MEEGNYHELRVHMIRYPHLVKYRDETNATLLIRLIDYPGRRPNAAKTARVLLIAGCEVDARRDADNGTALSGALSTGEVDVARVLLEFGASLWAKLGFKDGDVIDLARELSQGSNGDTNELAKAVRKLVVDFTGLSFE